MISIGTFLCLHQLRLCMEILPLLPLLLVLLP